MVVAVADLQIDRLGIKIVPVAGIFSPPLFLCLFNFRVVRHLTGPSRRCNSGGTS